MSSLVAYPVVVATVLGLVALFEVLAALYALVESCFLGQGARWIARPAACAATAAALARAFAIVGRRDAVPVWRAHALSALVGRAPLALTVLALALLGCAVAALVARLGRLRTNRITPDSVKEALDALPDGVCFSRPDGRPLLVNANMDRLAHDALGQAVSNEAALWQSLSAGACQPGYAVERLGAGDHAELLLTTPAGHAWEFRRQTLAVEGATVVETVATNVTEERALAVELARRNDHLAAVNRRLRAFGADLTRLTREEEVLAAKVRVHDEVGRALVALRAYERQRPGERDRVALLAQWHAVTDLLRTAAADEEPRDAWEQLVQAAAAVGVRVTLEGALPAGGAERRLAMALVHECLNNAVRHADAHELRVCVTQGERCVTLRITNDGAAPVANATETGGLANLRRLVEGASGTMQVTWSPRFELCACLAREES